MEFDSHRKQKRGVEEKQMEDVRFLLGQCLFSWMAKVFFSPFNIILMVPLKYIQPPLPAPSASTLCHLVNGRQVLSSQTAENRLSIETGSCVSCFYFQKYLILLLSVVLQLHGEGWDSRKTALLLSFLRYQDGFSKEIEESLLLGIFWSKAFRLCYFWKFQFSLVQMTRNIPSISLSGSFLWPQLRFKFINKCKCASASYRLSADRQSWKELRWLHIKGKYSSCTVKMSCIYSAFSDSSSLPNSGQQQLGQVSDTTLESLLNCLLCHRE